MEIETVSKTALFFLKKCLHIKQKNLSKIKKIYLQTHFQRVSQLCWRSLRDMTLRFSYKQNDIYFFTYLVSDQPDIEEFTCKKLIDFSISCIRIMIEAI